MNSILGSVVPLAMFFIIAREAFKNGWIHRKLNLFSRSDQTRNDEQMAKAVFCIVDTGSCLLFGRILSAYSVRTSLDKLYDQITTSSHSWYLGWFSMVKRRPHIDTANMKLRKMIFWNVFCDWYVGVKDGNESASPVHYLHWNSEDDHPRKKMINPDPLVLWGKGE